LQPQQDVRHSRVRSIPPLPLHLLPHQDCVPMRGWSSLLDVSHAASHTFIRADARHPPFSILSPGRSSVLTCPFSAAILAARSCLFSQGRIGLRPPQRTRHNLGFVWGRLHMSPQRTQHAWRVSARYAKTRWHLGVFSSARLSLPFMSRTRRNAVTANAMQSQPT